MCNTADCRCKHSVNPRCWNLVTALFSLNDITIGSYYRCQLPIESLGLDQTHKTTSNMCRALPKALLLLFSETSQFRLLLSFLPALYLHHLPSFPPPQTLCSLSDSLVPGSAVSWGDATLSRSGSFSVRAWPSSVSKLHDLRASLNKLFLKIFHHFPKAEGNSWTWEVHFLTQTEFKREVNSLVGLYRHFQICKGVGFCPVWTLGWSQFPFPFWWGSSFLRAHVCSFSKKNLSCIYNFSHLEMKL